jgi:E3 ubiquitin-protein ligase Mdm2
VVQPLPLPAPIQCRVVYAEGATIRSGVELSSAEVGHAPAGTVLAIVGRVFSEYPTDNCIERLKLAGGAGWISARLNRPPPLDESLVELVGIDDNFDSNDPGPYHLKAQAEVMEQTGGGANNGPPNSLVSQATRRLMRTMSTAELSSIHDDDEGEEEDRVATSGGRGGEPYHGTGMTLYRNGMGGGALAMAPPGHEICLICLTDERDATIVHGGTGHIATCLGCARILKARGDNCPVCRLPIDMVIQQFWA